MIFLWDGCTGASNSPNEKALNLRGLKKFSDRQNLSEHAMHLSYALVAELMKSLHQKRESVQFCQLYPNKVSDEYDKQLIKYFDG